MQNFKKYDLLPFWLSVCAWMMVLIVATFLSLKLGRTVSNNYYAAAIDWSKLQPLYNGRGVGFIHLLQSAICYLVFAIFPFHASEVLWRVVNWALIFGGVYAWLRYYCNASGKPFGWCLLLFSLLFIPIGFSSLRNGQMNMLLVSGVLWFFWFYHKHRFSVAGFILGLVFFMKPTFIVFILLAFILYPKVRKSLAISFLFFLILPFLTNFHWHYVLGEYQAMFKSLIITANVGSDSPTAWAQIMNTLSVVGVNISGLFQNLIRVIFALLTLFLAFRAHQLSKNKITEYFIVSMLFATYLMLFNPRTESNDYIVLSAAVAIGGVSFWLRRAYIGLLGTVLLTLGVLFSSNISTLLTPNDQCWFAPIMALICYLYIAYAIYFKRRVD